MLNHVVRQKAEGQAPSVSAQSVDIRVTYKTEGVSLTKNTTCKADPSHFQENSVHAVWLPPDPSIIIKIMAFSGGEEKSPSHISACVPPINDGLSQ